MPTLETVFAAKAKSIEEVHKRAFSALSNYCSRRGFLITHRIKNSLSLKEKLDTGRFRNLAEIDDLLAYSIVIDVQSQSQEVVHFLRETFSVSDLRGPKTLRDERIFDFDSTRAICQLQLSDQPDSPLNDLLFEVQVKTVLQFAWSKITHPLVYKPEKYDAQRSRLAAETLARLESVDRTFENFERIAPTVKAVRRPEMIAVERITSLIDSLIEKGVIPADLRPANGRRLGENILTSVRYDKRRAVDTFIEVLEVFFLSQENKFPRSVSLFELAVLALHSKQLLERGRADRPRHYHLSDELISLFPQASAIPNRIVVN